MAEAAPVPLQGTVEFSCGLRAGGCPQGGAGEGAGALPLLGGVGVVD